MIRTTNRRKPGLSRPGVTLIELMLAVTVTAIALAAAAPIMVEANEGYITSTQTRRTSEDASFALEVMLRALRDAPVDFAAVELQLQTAEPTRLLFDDGSGFRIDTDTLLVITPAGDEAVLCRRVGGLTFTYFGSDGETDTSGTPRDTRRIAVTITVEGFTLAGAAMPRALMGAT